MPIRQEYIFTIGTAYTKTAEDDIEIANDIKAKLKWKDGYKSFKPNIRNHLKMQQNGRCAFCRCLIYLGQGYANLEHLVSKDDYPQFQFLPSNLVYCCWICNKSKLKKNTISNPNAINAEQQFPTGSNGFVIINPYHDNYEDHIEFLEEVLIIKRGSSTKGENTIEYYKLARPELAEDRAREFKLNTQTIKQQLLLRLTSSTNDESIINQIHTIIAQLPRWTL